MVKIILKQLDQSYLNKCATEHKFAFGIIIGQRSSNGEYIVIHLARNGEEDPEILDASETDIDSQILASQYINAFKMIPGSFSILGIFIASESDEIMDESFHKSVKKLLCDMMCIVNRNGSLYNVGNDLKSETLILLYSTKSAKLTCTSYLHDSAGTFSPIECCLNEINYDWMVFESNYGLDDIFPIIDSTEKIEIEKHFHSALTSVKIKLETSEIFIQNENVDDSMSVEAFIKQKYGKPINAGDLRACIFLPVAKRTKANDIEVKEFNGTICFAGVVSSRIWCHPKNTIKEVKMFVRTDILRSLAARIQVYCDGLTLPNAGGNPIVISEPPRRVYFNLPEQNIQFSEYIFRGETPTVAVAHAKQILDLDLDSECIYADLEGLSNDDVFLPFPSETLASNKSTWHPEITRTMYMLGIAVALIVLIISIILQFFMP